jgi:hypothetical protein
MIEKIKIYKDKLLSFHKNIFLWSHFTYFENHALFLILTIFNLLTFIICQIFMALSGLKLMEIWSTGWIPSRDKIAKMMLPLCLGSWLQGAILMIDGYWCLDKEVTVTVFGFFGRKLSHKQRARRPQRPINWSSHK